MTKTKKWHLSTEQIYEKLERCAKLGRSDGGGGGGLSKRTASMLDDLLRLKENDWSRCGDAPGGPETTTTVVVSDGDDVVLAVQGCSDAEIVVVENSDRPLVVDAKEGKPRSKISRVFRILFNMRR